MNIENEQQAALGLLIISAQRGEKKISDAQIEAILRIVIFCKKFTGENINQLFKDAYSMILKKERNDFIVEAASFIEEGFKETLFAMCCEAAFSLRKWEDSDSDTLATIGIAMQVPAENIKNIVRTYIIRSLWNIDVTET